MRGQDYRPGKQDRAGIRSSQDSRSSDNGLDRDLDAALAKYAAVEPRPGLEDRILANLRTEQTRVAERTWWRWGLAGVLAAAVAIVELALAWRSGKLGPVVQTPTTQQRPIEAPAPAVETFAHDKVQHAPVQRRGRRAASIEVTAANPKLEVFPSPQPMSEQERLLTNYVAQHSDRAAVIAEARMEWLRQDAEERRQLVAGERDSQQ